MRRKYKHPPVNEVVIGVYFKDPILAMRAEHVGLFWSVIKDDFPEAAQNVPIGAEIDISASGEVFPLPRFWFMSENGIYLIQVQRNAFLLNWRQGGDAYPHYEAVKASFDRWLGVFMGFCERQFGIARLDIARCELNYVNLIGPVPPLFLTFADTEKAIPSYRALSIGPDRPARAFSLTYEYPIASDLALTVIMQSRKNQQSGEDVIYLELRTGGELQAQTDASLSGWFERAHDAIGDAFNALTSETLQKEHWRFMTEESQ
ncbi:uncharacterized protein (TIGR04255 family) [Amaricoccus macauensis]|uniref:Uncharacterized protein (TIGR04255 family) n=1 Tax=Amaricoccus macauensis TaxID=57001 RepID=A0A840SZ85_9RHOB|nr:TIGR04255 family protein [Amaricoccus macauensis]MBB5224513.1 uncharacterized protein (TIGR04255 family) [Amaricoccus macauensis]